MLDFTVIQMSRVNREKGYYEILHPSRTVTAKKCAKKCDTGAKLLFCLLNLLLFCCSHCILKSLIVLFSVSDDGAGRGSFV